MQELKPEDLDVRLNCIPAARGVDPEELARLIVGGWIFLDIMPVRRELTSHEKLTNPNIPATATHVAEPMIVFYKIQPVTPPLLERTGFAPGVN